MEEIIKEQFKEIYLANSDPEIKDPKYYKDYWDKFYEHKTGAKYFYEKPKSPQHNRMTIVSDYSNKQEIIYRIFFRTEEEEEFSFKPDFDGKWD